MVADGASVADSRYNMAPFAGFGDTPLSLCDLARLLVRIAMASSATISLTCAKILTAWPVSVHCYWLIIADSDIVGACIIDIPRHALWCSII